MTLALAVSACPDEEEPFDDDTSARDDDTGVGDDDVTEDDDSVGDDDTTGDDDSTGDDDTVHLEFSLSHADARIVGTADQFSIGNDKMTTAGDLNGDGLSDLAFGTDTSLLAHAAGSVYVIHAPVAGNVDISGADAILAGTEEWAYANYAEFGGDLDGDGFGDLLVGARGSDVGGNASGALYILHGPFTGTTELEATAYARVAGEAEQDQMGWGVAGNGDMDGDGRVDFVVGAYKDDTGAMDAGAAYLFRTPVEGEVSAAMADAKFVGEDFGDQTGFSVSIGGDLDADGRDDLVIGAEASGTEGAAFVFYGAAHEGTISVTDADARLEGVGYPSRAGYSVAIVGDVNGDGFDDVVVGAPDYSGVMWDGGAAYLVHGPVYGTMSLGLAEAVLTGEWEHSDSGREVSAAGDVNADGFSDFLVGSACWECDSRDGTAYLYFGPVSGTPSLGDAHVVFLGEDEQDGVGVGVSAAGDVDGDGFDDVLIGAPWRSEGYWANGVAYLVNGPMI